MRKCFFSKALSVLLVAAVCGSTALTGNRAAAKENDELKTGDAVTAYIEQFENAKYADSDIINKFNTVEIQGTGETVFNVKVEETAIYSVKIGYTTYNDSTEPISFSMKIDGQYPYSEFKEISLPRFFKDDGDKRSDNSGNEISKEIKQVCGDYEYVLKNSSNTKELLLYLEAGNHTLSFTGSDSKFAVSSISFVKPSFYKSYSEYLSGLQDKTKYKSSFVLEAENTISKTSADMVQLSDNSSAAVSPSDSKKDKINYIGGGNWSQPGDSISWEVNVPEDGLYKLGFNYRQNYTLNTAFYRELRIDGAVPFSEASEMKFPYSLKWNFITMENDNGDPYWFFLSKGKHTLTLSVTLGELAGLSETLENAVYGIGELYRKIIMITGDVPDSNRDYNLFERISNLEELLNGYINTLNDAKKSLSEIFKSDSVSSITTVNSMINVMELMLDNKHSAHKYVSRYYDNYASLSSMRMELTSMPLDIDRIYFGDNFNKTGTSFLKATLFSFSRFLNSFSDDYSVSSANDKKITLWVNWGRDQAKVLKYLIQSDFTTKNNIDVDIKVTNATLTHAALSGDGPDVQLQLSRSEPVNLAMRNAVCDLTQFSDYAEIAKRFKPTASDCYKLGDGIYALPDQQTFFMMFIRKDIFEDMGLSVPKTWDEFIETSVLLLRQNMQVGLPYTQISEMTQVNAGVGALSIFPTLLYQSGGKLYNDDQSDTMLLSDKSINAFTTWTDFYVKYGLPKTYDFFNRFRLGLMPMAIQNYTLYATLTAGAPEITDSWEMYEIPGVPDENGNINNVTTGGGTASVILSNSKNKEASWEFLKWWTSEEIQYRYGNEIENILGSSARHPSANVEAVKRFNFNKSTLNNIMKQWDKVIEVPEVPGGYNVSRVLDQAFWNVVNASENPKDMLMKWNDVARVEIERKRQQYNIGE